MVKQQIQQFYIKTQIPLNRSAFTLIEVVIVTALILLFSVVAFETASVINQREKEGRLKQALIEMRGAIDAFQQDHFSQPNQGLPDTFSTLVTTPTPEGGFYLRRFSINPMFRDDPITPKHEQFTWEISDKTTLAGTGDTWREITSSSTSTVGGFIIDVRCPPSAGTGLNGIPYKDW